MSSPVAFHSAAAYHAQPMTSSSRVVHVGSRASTLAMIQTTGVVDKLTRFYPDVRMPIQKITTTGDKILGELGFWVVLLRLLFHHSLAIIWKSFAIMKRCHALRIPF